MRAAIAVENSDNAKLGRCSATYASQSTCPRDCAFLGAGCYAEYGPTGIITRRLNSAPRSGPSDTAREEAAAIDKLSGWRLLRLHVVGDCATDQAARILAAACARYADRGCVIRPRKKAWTYTHAWRAVKRPSWGRVGLSVLASCHTPLEALDASAKGYASALVVPEFHRESAYSLGRGQTLIPCPWQTRRITCEQCRLCLDDDRLLKNGLVIGFTPHGARKETVRNTLLSLEVLA